MTREEAIEVIKDIYNYTRWDTYTANEARTMAIKALEQAPRRGHWKKWYITIEQGLCTTHDLHCKCSECNKEYDPYTASLFNYCPNCGANMIESEVNDG